MDSRGIKKLLEQVKSGELPVDDALHSLRTLPYEDCGYAKLDLHRGIRTGFPEVVFCQGKTCEQSVEIVKRLAGHHAKILGDPRGARCRRADRRGGRRVHLP